MRQTLIVLGLVLLAAGLAWPWLATWLKSVPWGRLPGDVHVVREGFSFHFPVVTCVVISIVASLVIWWLRR